MPQEPELLAKKVLDEFQQFVFNKVVRGQVPLSKRRTVEDIRHWLADLSAQFLIERQST